MMMGRWEKSWGDLLFLLLLSCWTEIDWGANCCIVQWMQCFCVGGGCMRCWWPSFMADLHPPTLSREKDCTVQWNLEIRCTLMWVNFFDVVVHNCTEINECINVVDHICTQWAASHTSRFYCTVPVRYNKQAQANNRYLFSMGWVFLFHSSSA